MLMLVYLLGLLIVFMIGLYTFTVSILKLIIGIFHILFVSKEHLKEENL